jgi:hypothetical protein
VALVLPIGGASCPRDVVLFTVRPQPEVEAVVISSDQGEEQEDDFPRTLLIADVSVRGRTNDRTWSTHGGAPVASRAESSFSEGDGEVWCE